MFYLQQSNRLELLADQLIGELRSNPPPIFVDEVIVVPSAPIGRWLNQRIAQQLGIASGLVFPYPAAYGWSLIARVLEDVPHESPFDPAVMMWRLFAILREPVGASQAPAVTHYLGTGGVTSRLELAQALAQRFDAYAAYRPQWLEAWSMGRRFGLGEHERWQQQLWQRLTEIDPLLAGAHPMEAFFERLALDTAARRQLPPRLSLFGLDALAPLYLKFFERLSEVVAVNTYYVNPCEQYWADIVKERTVARAVIRDPDYAEHFDSPHRLLASLGAHGRALAEYFASRDFDEASNFRAPHGTHRLARLQRSILALTGASSEPRGASAAESITIHSCHSAIREAEVLHDQLLARFDADATLTPEDVVVLMSDPETYGAAIEAVFAAAPAQRFIPFSIADRGATIERPIVASVLALIDCAQSRFEAERVLQLLDEPRVARKFAFSDRDRTDLRVWVNQCGIRWGADASMRESLGLPRDPAFTWRAGLDRLILGAAMAADEARAFAGIVPFADVEGHGTDVVGRFMVFFDALTSLTLDLKRSWPFPDWCDRVARLIELFHALEPADQDDAVVMRGALDAAARASRRAAYDGAPLAALPAAIALAPIASALRAITRPGATARGGVMVAKLAPGSALPARVVCIVGMSEDLFARRDPQRGFDLIALHPQSGDRSVRAENRYAFLHAVLAARDAVLLTYTGRGDRDDAERPAATALTELEDALIDDGAVRQRYFTQHPLRPFSPRYFAPESSLFSYAAQWQPRQSSMSPTLPTPPTLAPPPTRTDTVATVATVDTDSSVVEVVALDDLIGMVTDPVKGFLREQLGIRLNDPDEAIDPLESFDLQGLDRYQVRTRMVEALLRGESPEHIFSLLNADALLQPGAHGVITFQDELAMLSPFVAALSALRRTFIAAARTVSIQLDFDSSDRVDGRTHWRIEGDVHDVYHHTGRGNESSLVHWKAGEFKPSGPNGWIALWIRHLALNAASGRTQTLVMQSAVSLTQPIVLSAINADDARACLRDWLWLFGSARQRLEKFWPAAAFAYAKRAIERKAGEDGNGAGNRAIKAAHEAWTPSYSDARFAGRAESARPYNALAARDDPHPLDQSFVGWAERLMVPLANAIQASETTKISDVTEAPNS